MKFHHEGWIVKDIDAFEKNIFHEGLVKRVSDPVQQAELALYKNYDGGYIELICPFNEQAFTWEALQKKGNHFHHNCYQVPSVAEMQEHAADKRLLLFKGPLNALLFDNHPVYFFMDRNRNIVEFLVQS